MKVNIKTRKSAGSEQGLQRKAAGGQSQHLPPYGLRPPGSSVHGNSPMGGWPCPPPGRLPDPGIKSLSLASPALAGWFFITSATQEAIYIFISQQCESESCSVLSDSLRPNGLYIQSMEFSKPEYWSGQPFPSPEDLSNLRVEPGSPTIAGGFCSS